MNSITNTSKRLTTNGLTLPKLLFIFLNMASVAVSIYLINHFFTEHFPTTLGSPQSICDISTFWSCSSTTYSPLSQIALIPIGVFSLILGIFHLTYSLFPSEQAEATGKFLAIINFIGCLGLLFYSAFTLGSLCPMCTLYYILSFGIFLLFITKSSLPPIPRLKISIIWVTIALITSFAVRSYHQKKLIKQESINEQIVQQFFKLPVGKKPNKKLGERLLKADSENAPIQVSMFSDFQCPYCKLLAQDLERAALQFKGKIEATYFSYPLDSSCNPNIKTAFHQSACMASYAASCAKDFKTAHDDIYHNQEALKGDFIQNYIKENGLTQCVNSMETKKKTLASINHGDADFQIKGTPTLIINGVRIKPLPKSQLIALFKAIINRAKSN